MELIGEVKGKNVILVDDMIDTGGTLSRRFNEKRSIELEQFVHMPFYQEIYKKNRKSQLLELIVTDSIPLKKESKNKSVELCPTFLKLCTWYIIIIPLVEIYHKKKQFLYLGC
jgi:ribose-phosphate pyrophosphokinase